MTLKEHIGNVVNSTFIWVLLYEECLKPLVYLLYKYTTSGVSVMNYSSIPRPRTMVIGLGARLVHK